MLLLASSLSLSSSLSSSLSLFLSLSLPLSLTPSLSHPYPLIFPARLWIVAFTSAWCTAGRAPYRSPGAESPRLLSLFSLFLCDFFLPPLLSSLNYAARLLPKGNGKHSKEPESLARQDCCRRSLRAHRQGGR